MPWNDASKPPQKPGPWDAPATEGERSAEITPGKPRRTGVTSPWGQEPTRGEQNPKPQDARRAARREPPKVSAPPPRGPHLDELSRQLRLRLATAALRPSDRRLRWTVPAAGLGALAAVWALSGVYIVQGDETAMVARFGAIVGEAGPGLHYHAPFPIDTVRRLPVGALNQLDLGPSGGDETGDQMLTRDGDLVDLAFSVQWRIADPMTYLSGLADPDATLRATAESVMRQVAGRLTRTDLLAPGHGQAAESAKTLLQAAMDRDRAGITLVGVQVRDVTPPDAALAGFHDLASAQADAQVQDRDAEAYRSRVTAAARADAAKLVQTSQGYRDQEVSGAKGEAARFALIDTQYRKAPQATRDRLYTETMERVLHGTNKIIVQTPPGGASSFTLPPELFRQKTPDAPPAPAAPAQPSSSSATSQGPSA